MKWARAAWMAGLICATVDAAEPSVPVKAGVVFASTAAGTVEPGLEKMQAALATRVKYATMKWLSNRPLVLGPKPASVELPNGKKAEVSVKRLDGDVATIRVKLAPAETEYTLGRDKSLYLQGGAFEGGDLWLVLSPP